MNFIPYQSRMTLPNSLGIITSEEYSAISLRHFYGEGYHSIRPSMNCPLRLRVEANPE